MLDESRFLAPPFLKLFQRTVAQLFQVLLHLHNFVILVSEVLLDALQLERLQIGHLVARQCFAVGHRHRLGLVIEAGQLEAIKDVLLFPGGSPSAI